MNVFLICKGRSQRGMNVEYQADSLLLIQIKAYAGAGIP
ncbi:hypothetical protein RK21_05042 [Pseudomonas plecoglossicida]|nr:hypothetical protein RK21_05042 [Pseudomonas plecoglossicida]